MGLVPPKHSQEAPGSLTKNTGAAGIESDPETSANRGEHAKVVNLPGRYFNPRRLQLWRSLKSNKTFFNVCLRASDREVACNLSLLVEESTLFASKLSNPAFAVSEMAVQLGEVNGDTLETVIAALLNATIKLDQDNLEQFLHCADMLRLSAVKAACCVYMKDTLNEHSAATTMSLATKFSCDDVLAYTHSYIVDNFYKMPNEVLKGYAQLVFKDLISRDNLSIYTELQVLTAITVWCHHNGPEAFLDLLPAVRLERMSVHELQIMSQHAMILQHPPALDRVHAALATAKPLGNPPGNPRKLRDS